MQRWPVTARLNPFPLAEKLPYLLGSVIVARTLVGLTRIVADNPAWNPTPNSRRDKMDTFIERIFMEGLGTMGTFLVLHAGQDVTANLLELARPTLRPVALLQGLRQTLPQPDLVAVEQALARTFQSSVARLGKAPVLARVLYDGANLFNFRSHLNDERVWQAIATPVEDHFASLNRAAKVPVVGGLVAATIFGGPFWQWLNDRVVRTEVVPRISEPLVHLWGDDARPASPPELSPMRSMVVASQPLVRLAGGAEGGGSRADGLRSSASVMNSGLPVPPAITPNPGAVSPFLMATALTRIQTPTGLSLSTVARPVASSPLVMSPLRMGAGRMSL